MSGEMLSSPKNSVDHSGSSEIVEKIVPVDNAIDNVPVEAVANPPANPPVNPPPNPPANLPEAPN